MRPTLIVMYRDPEDEYGEEELRASDLKQAESAAQTSLRRKFGTRKKYKITRMIGPIECTPAANLEAERYLATLPS